MTWKPQPPIPLEQLIERFKHIHGNTYEYIGRTKSETNRTSYKVDVKCNTHGVFSVFIHAHAKGLGCPSCRREQQRAKRQAWIESHRSTSSKEEHYMLVAAANTRRLTPIHVLLEKFTSQHGNKFVYDFTNYKRLTSKITITCPIHGEFTQSVQEHIKSKYACRACANCSTSKLEQDWLDKLNIPKRNYTIKDGNKRFRVDGYDPDTETVYEFLGDYWHGNPNKFNPNETNKRTGKTFKQLYEDTFDRLIRLKQLGYKIFFIWESEFLNNEEGQYFA